MKWETPFDINKCQILQVGNRNIKKDYEMCCVIINSVHSVKDLGVTVAFNLKYSAVQRVRQKSKRGDWFNEEIFFIQD